MNIKIEASNDVEAECWRDCNLLINTAPALSIKVKASIAINASLYGYLQTAAEGNINPSVIKAQDWLPLTV